jgi:hypothetical protein
MVRRWIRGLLVTVIVGFVVATAVGSAAAPLAALLPSTSISADLGSVHIQLAI